MPQRVKAARIDFYNPATDALRYSLESNLRSIEIQEVTRDVADDATFTVAHNFANLDNFVVGDECRVYVQTEADGSPIHIWTGIVDSVRSTREGMPYADLPIRAQDYVSWTLNHRFVTDGFENMAAGAIVRYLVENYAPTIGTTYIEDTDITVPTIQFHGESLLSAIRRLAEMCEAEFKGDKDKELHFYARASKSSGLSVDAATVVRGSFECETSFADFGNVITVYGGQRKEVEAEGPTALNNYTAVTGIVRQKARIFFRKSRVARVTAYTDPRGTTTTADRLSDTVSAHGGISAGTFAKRAQGISFSLTHILEAGTELQLRLRKAGTPTGTATLRLSSDKDLGGLTTTLDVATLTTSYASIAFSFTEDFVFEANTTYYLTLDYSGGDASNNLQWAINSSNLYAGGTRWTKALDGTWSEITGGDYLFRIDAKELYRGDLIVRIQADNETGTAPVSEGNAAFDLASTSLGWEDLSRGDWTAFDLPDHVVPAGNYVWLIVESDADSQRIGRDASNAILYRAYFDLPVIVQSIDADSIAHYGRHELPPVHNLSVVAEDEAQALAARMLAEKKDPVRRGRYEVLDIATLGAAPLGQTVSASFPTDGIAEGTPLIVLSKQHRYDADRGTYSLVHEYVDAVRVIAADVIIRSLANRIKRLEDRLIPVNTLSFFGGVADTARFSETTATLENDPELDSFVDSAIVDYHRVFPQV